MSHSLSSSNRFRPQFKQYFIFHSPIIYQTYNILYHSTVFRTINPNAENNSSKYGIGNQSFADIKNAYSVGGIKGAINSLSPTATKKDFENVKEYNRLVSEEGVSAQTAWYRTMQTSSDAVKSLFDDENNLVKSGNALILSEDAITKTFKSMTLGAKAGQVALKGLKMAGNALATAVISVGVEALASGIEKTVNYEENMNKASSQMADNIKSSASTLDSYKDKIESLRATMSDSSQNL